MMSLLWIILSLIIGIWIGSVMAYARWKSNAHYPARIKVDDKFYKVVLISNPWSWEMADIHRDDVEKDNG